MAEHWAALWDFHWAVKKVVQTVVHWVMHSAATKVSSMAALLEQLMVVMKDRWKVER